MNFIEVRNIPHNLILLSKRVVNILQVKMKHNKYEHVFLYSINVEVWGDAYYSM